MEKLYELLFDYSRNKSYYWSINYGKIEGDVGGTDHTLEGEEVAMVIKSKEFGFIKWLVENEKIDVEKVYNNSDYPMVKRDEFLYEGLLMLLAIQDEPIEFLVSILK